VLRSTCRATVRVVCTTYYAFGVCWSEKPSQGGSKHTEVVQCMRRMRRMILVVTGGHSRSCAYRDAGLRPARDDGVDVVQRLQRREGPLDGALPLQHLRSRL